MVIMMIIIKNSRGLLRATSMILLLFLFQHQHQW
jgi:hypothetical protein